MKAPFILYQRTQGGRSGRIYHVGFLDEETGTYRHRRSTGQTSRVMADEIAKQWLSDGGPIRSKDLFLDYLNGFWSINGEYARIYAARNSQSISAMYLQNNKYMIDRYVVPFFEEIKKGKLLIQTVTPGHIEKLIHHLLENTDLSKRTVNTILQAISVPMREAERLGRIKINPCRNIKKLHEDRKERKILSADEAKKFFALTWDDQRFRIINLLAASTGMRLGECLGLQKEDIVQTSVGYFLRIINNWQALEGLKAPKTGSRGEIPVPDKVAEALIEIARLNPYGNGFVFWGGSKEFPLNRGMVQKDFSRVCEEIGIKKADRMSRGLTFHAWRHWFNSMMRGKVPDHVLREMTRHKQEAMTERYSHLTEEQVSDVKRGVEGLLSDVVF